MAEVGRGYVIPIATLHVYSEVSTHIRSTFLEENFLKNFFDILREFSSVAQYFQREFQGNSEVTIIFKNCDRI